MILTKEVIILFYIIQNIHTFAISINTNMDKHEYVILKEFEDGKVFVYFPLIGCMNVVDVNDIENGTVSPFIYNVGYIKTDCIDIFNNLRYSCSFDAWRSMMSRCYNNVPEIYKDVTVCDEWHNFINFAIWHKENYVQGWYLDKDLFRSGDKIYSKDTCCYIPNEINISIKAKIAVLQTKGGSYYFNDTAFSFSTRRVYGDTYSEAYKMCVLYRQTYIKTLVAKYWKSMRKDVINKLIHLYDNEEGQIFKNKRYSERKREKSEGIG